MAPCESRCGAWSVNEERAIRMDDPFVVGATGFVSVGLRSAATNTSDSLTPSPPGATGSTAK
jgi:hypothetical protein